jgi:magnesium transporter
VGGDRKSGKVHSRMEKISPEVLRSLLLSNDAGELRAFSARTHPHDMAESLSELEDDEIWQFLQILDVPQGAAVLSHLEVKRQVSVLAGRHPSEIAPVLEAMAPDDRTDLVQNLPRELRTGVLAAMQGRKRGEVELLGVYAADTAGGVMSTEVGSLKADLTVGQAIDQLRAMAEQREQLYYNYIVDDRGRLQGIVSLRDLMLSHSDRTLSEIMNPEVFTAFADEDVEQVTRKIREYDLIALPVVDAGRRLLGVVTVDDVMDAAEEEATEDIHKIGGSGGLAGTSLREVGLGVLYGKRIPWLLVLVFINIFSGAGLAYFEDTIASAVALVFFLPLLIDSGGNAGSQAATLMVRALATGDVQMSDWARLLGKEVAVALALGVTMAMGAALIASLRAPEVLGVVTASMVLIVLVGSLIGMLLPFAFTRLGFDPATASAPLITSVADICGVLIYFAIATWWLGIQSQA